MHKRLARAIPAAIIYLLSSYLPLHAWGNDYIDEKGDSIATLKSLEDLFSNVLIVVIRFVGIATLIMIIVGGFKYLTSGGDSKATEAAQQTITLGIIGLILAIASWFIINAISGFTGNTDILNFTIGI